MKTLLHTLALCAIGCMLCCTSCMPPRSFYLLKPDLSDYKRFKNAKVPASSKPFCFEQGKRLNHLMVDDCAARICDFVTLDKMLENNKNHAFIIIRNDSILFERYDQKHHEQQRHASFSLAKSFVAAMVGIAIKEGKIKSLDQKVTDFIPELAQFPEAQTLTIDHLLCHTSGIKSRMTMDGSIYYSRNVLRGLKKIRFAHQPGQKQFYVNINLQLAGIFLARATGMSNHEYLQEKIWKGIGMESDMLWSIDKNRVTKSFCCMMATAKDFAKLGRLYLHKGKWFGEQLIDEKYITNSVSRDTTNGRSFSLGRGWLVGDVAYGDFMAAGMYEQRIYVYPKKNIIIVSLNGRKSPYHLAKMDWYSVFHQIVDQL